MTRMICPRCHQETGKLLPVEEADERDDLPDGLASVTPVQCQDPHCRHEWEIVTHAQILRSMARWPSHQTPPQRGTL